MSTTTTTGDVTQQSAVRQATIQGHDDFDTQELAVRVYDMLMADIEPDLLSYNIDLLDDYYAGETDAAHTARMARYEAAYTEFDRVFEEFMQGVSQEVRSNRRSALREREHEAQSAEADTLQALESAFG